MSLFFKLPAVALALAGLVLMPGCKADQLNLGTRARRNPEQSIVIADQAKQRPPVQLRVCNAYGKSAPLELLHRPGHHHGDSMKISSLTAKDGSLAYKGCREWNVDLRRGDSLEFLQDSTHLGSFSVSAVPQLDTLLLLVVHRRKSSARPAFASHVFAKAKSAQVAILDMYQGLSRGKLAIQEDKPQDDSQSKKPLSVLSEELSYDSVVALDGGKYICKLVGGEKPKQLAMTAKAGESYVAMRVGDDKDEEIVVFPMSSCNGYSICWGSLLLAVAVVMGF